VDDVLEVLEKPELDVEKQKQKIKDILGLKPGQPLPDDVTGALGGVLGGGDSSGAKDNGTGLLNFLLAP
jgi:hypothetical protein